MARNEEFQEKLCLASWDLVVFDEAHKLSAHFFGKEVEEHEAFQFRGEIRPAHSASPTDDCHAS